MRFLSILIIIFCLLLSSCNTLEHIDVMGEDSKTELEIAEGDTVYIANKSSLTYHIASCYIAKKISQENRVETKRLDFLTERGFEPCKICIDKN